MNLFVCFLYVPVALKESMFSEFIVPVALKAMFSEFIVPVALIESMFSEFIVPVALKESMFSEFIVAIVSVKRRVAVVNNITKTRLYNFDPP